MAGPTLGTLLDSMQQLGDERCDLDAQSKGLKAKYDELKTKAIQMRTDTMAGPTLGTLLDSMQQLRDERRDLDAQSKDLKTKYDELEVKAIDMMQKLGLDKASGELATASLSEVETPSVTDWTQLLRFIKRNGAYQLFERRIAKGAWMELVESRKGKALPGVESYTNIRINLRTR